MTVDLDKTREERGDMKCEACSRWIAIAREPYFEDAGGGYICRDCWKGADKIKNPDAPA